MPTDKATIEDYLQLSNLGDGHELTRDQRLVILALMHFNKALLDAKGGHTRY